MTEIHPGIVCDMKNVCRTCVRVIASQQKRISLFTIDNDSKDQSRVVDSNDFDLKKYNINRNDGLPQQICYRCSCRLVEIHEFHQQIKQSQEILEKCFKYESLLKEGKATGSSGLTDPAKDVLNNAMLEFVDGESENLGIGTDDDYQSDAVTELKLNCNNCEEWFNSKIQILDHLKYCKANRKVPINKRSKLKKCRPKMIDDNPIEQKNDKICFDYPCDECEKVFLVKGVLNQHKKFVHATPCVEVCPICHVTFTNPYRYKYHLKKHEPNKKYKCKYCDKSFLQPHHLKDHESTHTGVKPYLCAACGKGFNSSGTFSHHIRIHKDFTLHKRNPSTIKQYKCDYCFKIFAQKGSLDVHIRTHTGEKPFQCQRCNLSFAQKGTLNNHYYNCHTNRTDTETNMSTTTKTNNYPYNCTVCEKKFSSPTSLNTHIEKHNESSRKYICPTCGTAFKRDSHLRNHINTVHLKLKPYNCTKCDKCFAMVGGLNEHMKVHNNELYDCSYCKRTFNLKGTLRVHMRQHTDERPYRCDYCGNNFKTHASFKYHLRKHATGQVI